MTRELNIMDIIPLGHSSFRIKGKNATVITDPYDNAMLGFKYPKVNADIVTVSHLHGDHNATSQVTDVKRVIEGPGEYEVMGVSVIGFASDHDDKKGEERGKNTIYLIEIDDLRIVHLGDLGHVLSEELIEEMGNVDIMMVPVGGFYTIDSEKASKIVRDVEPSIVIPMHYKVDGMVKEIADNLAAVDDFLKETGLSVERMEKLSLKRPDIPEEGQKIVVLESKS